MRIGLELQIDFRLMNFEKIGGGGGKLIQIFLMLILSRVTQALELFFPNEG